MMIRFIPAEKLKSKYNVLGHFYSVELARRKIVDCRSVLEIVEKNYGFGNISAISKRTPDSVFIMMNPGSSRPLVDVNNHIHAKAIGGLSISLVPTKPDTTQYQVMRVMHFCNWRHVRVLNLSDLRCSQSGEFFKQFRQLEEEHSFDSHSIFSDRRRNELASKLTKHNAAPVICAWGVSGKLDPLIERCTLKLAKHKIIRGLVKEGTSDRYLHPLPSLQSQQLQWVNEMVQHLQG
jgi:hypothetical protein